MGWMKWLVCWLRRGLGAPIHGVMAHMGFSQRTACSQAGGPQDAQAGTGHTQKKAGLARPTR